MVTAGGGFEKKPGSAYIYQNLESYLPLLERFIYCIGYLGF